MVHGRGDRELLMYSECASGFMLINVLSHVSPNRRHNPSVFPQTLAPLATHDSTASPSPVLQSEIEAARHGEPRTTGDVHARCSNPDGPVFSHEGY